MKLELKQIAPYLLYGLIFYRPYLIYTGGENPQPDHEEWGQDEVTFENVQRVIDSGMPLLLIPLSELTMEDLDFSEYYLFIDLRKGIKEGYCSYKTMIYLIERHYDVFGLIEKGLAIDKNTI
jgi:hypothetical protein